MRRSCKAVRWNRVSGVSRSEDGEGGKERSAGETWRALRVMQSGAVRRTGVGSIYPASVLLACALHTVPRVDRVDRVDRGESIVGRARSDSGGAPLYQGTLVARPLDPHRRPVRPDPGRWLRLLGPWVLGLGTGNCGGLRSSVWFGAPLLAHCEKEVEEKRRTDIHWIYDGSTQDLLRLLHLHHRTR